MRAVLTLAALLLLAACNAACSTIGGGSTFTGDGLKQFLTDPACAHDDEIEFATTAGGMPAYLKGKASRHCPGPTKVITGVGGVVYPLTTDTIPPAPGSTVLLNTGPVPK